MMSRRFDFSKSAAVLNLDRGSGEIGTIHLANVPLSRPVSIGGEVARWDGLSRGLRARVENGELTRSQLDTFVEIWSQAQKREPCLRYPAVGVNGQLIQASWAFADDSERVFTLEIDAEGRVDWFYRDGQTTAGSEEPKAGLPPEASDHLVKGFARQPRGR